jgi:hypothetical protein
MYRYASKLEDVTNEAQAAPAEADSKGLVQLTDLAAGDW